MRLWRRPGCAARASAAASLGRAVLTRRGRCGGARCCRAGPGWAGPGGRADGRTDTVLAELRAVLSCPVLSRPTSLKPVLLLKAAFNVQVVFPAALCPRWVSSW